MSGFLLYVIAKIFSIPVNSFHRSITKNTKVGGVVNSKHLTAQAIDIPAETAPFYISVFKLMGYKVIDERSKKNHYHIQIASGSEFLLLLCVVAIIIYTFERKF